MFLKMRGKTCIPLELFQLYLIGKQAKESSKRPTNFIELQDEEEICERHCVIEVNHNKEVFVFDLLSLKGTLLNNKKLNSLEKTRLNNDDILKLGKYEIKYVDKHGENNSGFLEITKAFGSENSIDPPIARNMDTMLSNSSYQNDSLSIPETQYCQTKTSLNGSRISIAESIPDQDVNIRLNFANSHAFEDDDIYLPETQEVLVDSSFVPTREQRSASDLRNGVNEISLLKKVPSPAEHDDSQFRICTQDYNKGFGEEEFAEYSQSQTVPFIKFQLANINHSENENLIKQSDLCQNETEMCVFKRHNSKGEQEKIAIRTDCPTPDIVFEDVLNIRQPNIKLNVTVDKISTTHECTILDQDADDILPTQILPHIPVAAAVNLNKSLNNMEKSCIVLETESFLNLSDKENTWPVEKEATKDLRLPQFFEDEEDDLLTQALLRPATHTKKNVTLEERAFIKDISTFAADMAKTPLKQISSSLVFKRPENFSAQKTVSFGSSTLENDVDLLMCTPQLVKDTIFLGYTEELKRDILAAKAQDSFEHEQEEEDDDDKSDLVKLINTPKDALDFDKLLPHLSASPMCYKMSKEERIINEAKKRNRFNICFGMDQEASVSGCSTLSRDERHALRDKSKAISELEGQSKTKKENNVKTKEIQNKRKPRLAVMRTDAKDSSNNSNKLDQMVLNVQNIEENAVDYEETIIIGAGDCDDRSRNRSIKKPKKSSTSLELIEDKTSNKPVKNIIKRHSSPLAKIGGKQEYEMEEVPGKRLTRSQSKLFDGSITGAGKNLESVYISNQKQEMDKSQGMPSRRLTRAQSKLFDTPITDVEKDLDNIETQRILNVTKRIRHKSGTNESQSSQLSTTSLEKNITSRKNCTNEDVSTTLNTTKKNERKRKSDGGEISTSSVDRKKSKSIAPSKARPYSLSISMTMVDPVLLKSLLQNSKGLWHVAANCRESDVLVMDKPFRTYKFLLAMARGIPIVTSEYLKKLNEVKSAKKVQISDYHFKSKEFEKAHNFSIIESLKAAKNYKLLQGCAFLTTDNISPNPSEIKNVIEACGGVVYDKNVPQLTENHELYLVTSNEDKKDWHKYRRSNKNITIVSTEGIMATVLRQKKKMNEYKLA